MRTVGILFIAMRLFKHVAKLCHYGEGLRGFLFTSDIVNDTLGIDVEDKQLNDISKLWECQLGYLDSGKTRQVFLLKVLCFYCIPEMISAFDWESYKDSKNKPFKATSYLMT